MAAMAASSSSPAECNRLLAESLRRFCRSIELCDNYLRGYYGLKKVCACASVDNVETDKSQTSSQLLSTVSSDKSSKSDDSLNLPDKTTLQTLNQKATDKLTEIVRHASNQSYGWQGYDRAEVIAAKALLDRDAIHVIR